MPSFLDVREPRTWIVVLSAVGALFLLYVTIAASVPQGGGVSSYAVGDMRDFNRSLPPRPAPYETVQGPEGAFSLRDFEGQIVLVNVWATWCAPCVEELPSLVALADAMPAQSFEFVPVSLDTDREKSEAFLARLGIEMPVNLDRNFALATAIGAADTVPATILYDKRGREIGRLVGGADWSSPDAIRLVRAAVNGEI
ncbi:MAG: TlpA disulfide reductase family protein [Pseudomonadota bacterium]